MTMSTTRDAVAVQNRPAPKGKRAFCPSTALLLLDVVTTTLSSSRLAYGQNSRFQTSIISSEGQVGAAPVTEVEA